ncbi:hypothetical protein VMCG_05913 [Cytospora schulzeri]|uniref:Lytic polysaccharide monooxygenase n=1 Tax=Cytospora schulzeri TaxID=448051 RepID=A0A423WCY0_9PEZI|nr:hypothetical protein VMCG_05913 [Valsa malicola]
MLSLNKNTAVVALLSALMMGTAQSHMIMKTPMPYGQLDNSPLSSSGSNYPCKVTSDPATFYSTDGIISQNTMVAGESQTLSFEGSAVHGGGSCQLAITNDMQPSASTSWRVILSIESGCPSTDGSGPSTYNYTIPAETEPGQYSFAWTWISKLAGQPEYYMNCAPITVTAGSSSKTKRDDVSYPELFVANLESINSCKTTSGTDVVFPDPGPNVEKLLTGATPSFASISSSGCVPLSQTQGSGSLPKATAGGSDGSPAGTTASASPTAASSSSSSSSSSQSSSAIFAHTGKQGDGAEPTTLVTTTTTSKASSIYVIPVPHSSTSTLSPDATASQFHIDVHHLHVATGKFYASSTGKLYASSAKLYFFVGQSYVFVGQFYVSVGKLYVSVGQLYVSFGQLQFTTGQLYIHVSHQHCYYRHHHCGHPFRNPLAHRWVFVIGGIQLHGLDRQRSGTCNEEGTFNCVGSEYQQCASGAWTLMRPLAAGTTCQQGESKSLWARDVGTSKMRKARRGRGSFAQIH